MAIQVLNKPMPISDIHTGKLSGKELKAKDFVSEEWDDAVASCENKYWLTHFLAGFAGTKTVQQSTWNWVEDGKSFKKQIVKSATDVSATQIRLEFTDTKTYFCYADIIDSGVKYPGHQGVNAQYRVIESGIDSTSGCAYIVATLCDPQSTAEGNISAADFPADHQVTLLTNAFGECFEKPKCRYKMPEKYSGCLQKISNCVGICDDTASDVLWMKINGERYWTNYEKVTGQQEHMRQVDNAILFGQKSPFSDSEGYDGTTTMGLVPTLSFYSTIFHTVGDIVEDDLQQIMLCLGRQSSSKEWHIVMSPSKYMKLQNTFKDCFVVNGGMSFGKFTPGMQQTVGLNISSYMMGNYKLHFMPYEGFEDDDFLPQNDNGVDYKNLGLILNANKGSNIKIVYRKRRKGQILKNWMDERAGHTMAKDHKPTLDRACLEYQWTSEVGVQVKCRNQHGLIECE